MEFMSPKRLAVVAVLVSIASFSPGETQASDADTAKSTPVNSQNLIQQSQRPRSKEVPCTCRYQGDDFQQGQQVCIRGNLATCDMSLNNTSWTFNGQACGPVS